MVQGDRRCLVASLAALFLVLAGPPMGAARAQCVGDCDGNGQVSTAELESGVQIALLDPAAGMCPGFAAEVQVDDLVVAVNAALRGCPATPTPTTTPTPTATDTPGGVSNAVAGGAAVIAKSMSGIPSLITGLVSGLTYGTAPSGGASGEGGAAGACPAGGDASRVCTQTGLTAVQLSLGLNQCAVDTPGGTLTLATPSGPILLSTQSGQCPRVILPPINATADVVGVYRDGDGNPTLNTRATLTAVVEELQVPIPTPACIVTGTKLKATGSVSSAIPGDGGAVTRFFQTVVDVSIAGYSPDCVPIDYTLTFNGAAEVRDTSTNEAAAITFKDFVLHVDSTSAPTTFEMNGGLNFDCVQGAIELDTVTPFTANAGQLCPAAGRIHITTPEGPAAIQYLADGSVQVDVDNDGVFDNVFLSCIDPMLPLCPQS